MPTLKEQKQGTKEKIKTGDKVTGLLSLSFDDSGDESTSAIPEEIHVIPIGQWEHPLYGPILITPTDIREFCQNFNQEVRKGVFITAGHEGMNELPAVGWFKELEARDNGLWGKVEWNEDGKELLSKKAYKFFSPEFYQTYEDPQTQQLYRNVLTGGALTKSPYFKELEAVVFSEPKLDNSLTETSMNLQELLAKKAEEISAEEKTFVKEHQAELTDEQKTAMSAVLAPEETADEKTAREAKEAADKAAADAKAAEDAAAAAAAAGNGDGSQVNASEKVMITASELATLRTKANEGHLAMKELNAQKIEASVTALVFSEGNKNGKFLPKSKDNVKKFMESLDATQRLAFSALMSEVSTKLDFSERGTNSDVTAGTAKAELDLKVEAKMKADPKMKYSDALKSVLSENEGLEARFDGELTPVRGKN